MSGSIRRVNLNESLSWMGALRREMYTSRVLFCGKQEVSWFTRQCVDGFRISVHRRKYFLLLRLSEQSIQRKKESVR